MRKKMTTNEIFVSEIITPVKGTFDTKAMSRGEPGFPSKFRWRKKEYVVAEVAEKWKETTPCKSGGREKYVRKHWYKIVTTNGLTMKVYFERKSMSKGQAMKRWWLYSTLSQQ
ncbi:MAG: cytoplasmic protein [candidate division WOR-3 bacterium]|nr:MAG: cytoplasmic protein [candidate division WOR-3 bacterium]